MAACSRSASSAIFAFSPASIRRLVFYVIVRSVYQTERPFSNNPRSQNPRSAPRYVERVFHLSFDSFDILEVDDFGTN